MHFDEKPEECKSPEKALVPILHEQNTNDSIPEE